MIFLADENIPEHGARLLDRFDLINSVGWIPDYYHRGVADEVWIPGLAAWDEKPVIVCGDGRILRNKAQCSQLRTANLMFVHLAKGWTNIGWNDFAWKIIKAWPSVVTAVEKVRSCPVSPQMTDERHQTL
ncbi:MAG: hypothetical protein MI741_24485 [Rhodospirillales bacterium]|nr:hypothetical protein [Rhodospirillales bacterium]